MRTPKVLVAVVMAAAALTACSDDEPPAQPSTQASAAKEQGSLESDRAELIKSAPAQIREIAKELGAPAMSVQGNYETCGGDTGGAAKSAPTDAGDKPVQISASHPDVCVEVPESERGKIVGTVDNL